MPFPLAINHEPSTTIRIALITHLQSHVCLRKQNSIYQRTPSPGNTGFQSKELIIKAGLNLGDVDQHVRLDVTIDGADE